jgi:adenylyltransferase/sulfurtransferase
MAELPYMKALVAPGRKLTNDELARYSRHLLIPDIDEEGQARLLNAKVLCIGAGGLGSPTIMYLAAAGVGTIGIMDYDKVELSNLQRQIIHTQADEGSSKVQSAASKVRAINPMIYLNLHEFKLNENNAIDIFTNYDLIIDGTDNFATRYLINDAAAILGKPYIWGSVYRFDGQVSIFWSQRGPCYRCVHPTPPAPGLVPNCAEGGVLGSLCGTIGSLQATEAIKLITGIGEPLIGKILIHNALDSSHLKVNVETNANCQICSGLQTALLPSYEAFCGVTDMENMAGIDVQTLEQILQNKENKEEILLVDVREPEEFATGAIGNALLMPVSQFLDGSALKKLPKDRKIVLYCRSGIRSANCLAIMKAAGFINSTHLAGGILSWNTRVNS